jgi:hypothetical protein
MGYENLCCVSAYWDADSLLFNSGEVMRKKSKNNNYHTVLDYQKLGNELALRYHSNPEYLRIKNLSEEEVKQLPRSFLNYFGSSFPEILTITDHYHDIVTPDGRPDYRTIEILYLLTQYQYTLRSDFPDGFVVYNGFKVKFWDGGNDNLIYLGALLELGSNLNLHLLSYIVTNAPYKKFPSIKNSYIKLQEFFNETEENIKHALVSLQNLNLITFSEENNGDLIIKLNKDNILKLEKKHSKYSNLEEDIKINNHYKERIIPTTPACPHCLKELNMDNIKSILKNYDEEGNEL